MKLICTPRILFLVIGILLSACTSNSHLESLDFKQNEKVVFLGNAFFENAIGNGEIETTFSLCFPKKISLSVTLAGAGIMSMHTHAQGHAEGDDLETPRKASGY